MVCLLILRYQLSITLSNTPCLACLHPFSCQDVLRDTLFSFLQVIIKRVRSSRCHSVFYPRLQDGNFLLQSSARMIPMTLQKKPRANEDSHFSRWRFFDLIFIDITSRCHHIIASTDISVLGKFSDFNRLLVFCRDVFWTNLTNPKFLKEKTSWGRFLFEDVLMKIATYQHLKGGLF